jgi:hypothetical protein
MDVLVKIPDKRRYSQTFSISHFQFYISTRCVSLRHDDTVKVRCELHDAVHPHRYALKSLKTDPAAGLAVNVEGQDSTGNSFSIWLESEGEKVVFMMNTFVDLLSGIDLETSMTLPRRWVPHPTPGKGRQDDDKRFYTSEVIQDRKE